MKKIALLLALGFVIAGSGQNVYSEEKVEPQSSAGCQVPNISGYEIETNAGRPKTVRKGTTTTLRAPRGNQKITSYEWDLGSWEKYVWMYSSDKQTVYLNLLTDAPSNSQVITVRPINACGKGYGITEIFTVINP